MAKSIGGLLPFRLPEVILYPSSFSGGEPMAAHTYAEPVLDRSKPTPSVQTVGREEIETIADQLISENLEAFRKLAMPE